MEALKGKQSTGCSLESPPYGSPERKAIYRLLPRKSSSYCQELAKFIDLVAQGSANHQASAVR